MHLLLCTAIVPHGPRLHQAPVRVTMEDMTKNVVENVDNHRYEIYVDDELAGFVDYIDSGDALALPHTNVFPEFEGRGVGTDLIVGTLQAISERGRQVLPYCPFIPVVIKRHPEFVDLVPAGQRVQFGLA